MANSELRSTDEMAIHEQERITSFQDPINGLFKVSEEGNVASYGQRPASIALHWDYWSNGEVTINIS